LPANDGFNRADDFGFWEYELFAGRNWDALEGYVTVNRTMPLNTLQELGERRNALSVPQDRRLRRPRPAETAPDDASERRRQWPRPTRQLRQSRQ
jgi:hypothetical protein